MAIVLKLKFIVLYHLLNNTVALLKLVKLWNVQVIKQVSVILAIILIIAKLERFNKRLLFESYANELFKKFNVNVVSVTMMPTYKMLIRCFYISYFRWFNIYIFYFRLNCYGTYGFHA